MRPGDRRRCFARRDPHAQITDLAVDPTCENLHQGKVNLFVFEDIVCRGQALVWVPPRAASIHFRSVVGISKYEPVHRGVVPGLELDCEICVSRDRSAEQCPEVVCVPCRFGWRLLGPEIRRGEGSVSDEARSVDRSSGDDSCPGTQPAPTLRTGDREQRTAQQQRNSEGASLCDLPRSPSRDR